MHSYTCSRRRSCHSLLSPGKIPNSFNKPHHAFRIWSLPPLLFIYHHSHVTHPNPGRKLTYFDHLPFARHCPRSVTSLLLLQMSPSKPPLQSAEIHPSSLNSQMIPQRTSAMLDSFLPFSSPSLPSY